MSKDNFADGSPFSAEGLDSIIAGVNNEGIVSGGVPSVGTGNYDVDLTACDYVINDTDYSIAADTVTLSSASASDRVDIITADTTPGFNTVEGSPATNPNAPDIPSDEVLIAAVFVDSGSTSLVASDINDYRVIINRDATTYKGNDIDSDGDGKVDSAVNADDADTLDTRQATELEGFSTTNDGSDISEASGEQSQSGTTTIVNVSGSGFLYGGVYQVETNTSVEITVDGGATQSFSSTTVGTAGTVNGFLPPIRYESSLLVEVVGASGEAAAAQVVYR